MAIEIDQNRQAILDEQGNILVQGGPGSGKTTIALLKVKSIFPTLLPGQNILFLSFSRAAVRQVLNSCSTFLNIEEKKVIEVKTYHAFFLELLKSHGRLLAGKPVSIIYPSNELLLKSTFHSNWDTEAQRLATIEARFCFDQFAKGVAQLLEGSLALRKLMGNCYPTVIVDEFQDTDDDQWRVIKALHGVTRIFCLADGDQRIFEYRKGVDPNRIPIAQKYLNPTTFDLGADNHRSPTAGIVRFADTVLQNQGPIPNANEVKMVNYRQNVFDNLVHAAVNWTMSELKKQGVQNPCLAVLAKSNPLVGQLSTILSGKHVYKGQVLSPIEHNVVWDAEMTSAAGGVVASILEWTTSSTNEPLIKTFEAIAHYFELKNATKPSNKAKENVRKYKEAGERIRLDKTPLIMGAKALLEIYKNNQRFIGDPIKDWLSARDMLENINDLKEIFREVKMLPLFQAADAIGSGLADTWIEKGNYEDARKLVTQTLEHQRIIAGDQDPKGCLLMTMHKSKSKEFDGVVLVEGKYMGPFFDTNHEKPPFERSRRLLRVAITRAKKQVTIIRPRDAIPLVQ